MLRDQHKKTFFSGFEGQKLCRSMRVITTGPVFALGCACQVGLAEDAFFHLIEFEDGVDQAAGQ